MAFKDPTIPDPSYVRTTFSFPDKKPFIYAPRVPELPSAPSPVIQAPPVPVLPSIQDPRIIEPYKPQKSTILDYNDPYQINSIADIILTTFNKDMKRDPVNILGANISDIPILNIVPSLFQYVGDAYVNPISKGDWGAVGLNTLTNLSETLDVIANPVKGLIMEGPTGLINAMGWGSEGRKNYDYNTGNFFGDMALELISDPLNWVTLFGKGAVTSAVKNMTRTGLEAIGQETGEEIAEAAYKKLTKAIATQFMESTDKPMAQIAQEAAKTLMKNGKAPVQFTETFMKNLSKLNLDNTTAHILKSVNGIIKGADALDNALFKAGLGLPYAAGYAMKKAGSAVWEFAHTNFQKGLTKFATPTGNLDVAQYDAILEYAKRFDGTAKEVYNMEKEFPTKQVYDTYVQEALLREKENITHFMQTELKDMPNVNMSGKVKLLQEYLSNNIGIPYDKVLEILQDINIDNNNQYKWLYDWMKQSLDPERAKLLDTRAEVWGMVKDLQASIKELKDASSIDLFQTFEQYLGEKYHLTIEQLLKQAEDFEIVLGPEFKWLEEYFTNTMKTTATNPVFKKKHTITQKIWEILTAPKELEAETRYKLLDDFIQVEHKMSLSDYINHLKKTDARYPGIFTEYIKDLEDKVRHLELIDRLSSEHAVKEAAATTVKENNNLVKEQLDALSNLPNRAYMQMSAFSESYLKRRALNPVHYMETVLNGQEFTEQTLKEYLDRIHTNYDKYINKVLTNWETPELMMNQDYMDIMLQVHHIYEGYWSLVEKQLREQVAEHADGLYDFEKIFKDLPQKLNNLIEQGSPVLERYHSILNKADVLNATVDYDALLKKNAKDYEEALQNLLQFSSDKQFQHLQDKMLKLEKISTLRLQDFKSIKNDLSHDLFKFFDTGEKVNHITDMVENWLIKQSGRFVQKTDTIKTIVTSKGELRQIPVQETKIVEIPRIYEDAFINNFNELFTAIGEDNFKEFLETANSIVLNIQMMSLKNPEIAERFRPLYDIFKSYNIGDYKPFLADIEGEGVWYHFKLEQDYVINFMMANDDINKFIKELMDPDSELGGMLKNMILTEDNDASVFINSLESYLNYRGFLNTLYKYVGNPTSDLPIDHDVLGAFTSTLQKYAMRDPRVLLDNLENNFYYIIQQTEDQINSMKMPKSLSLDKLIPELEKDAKYADVLKGLEAHHAVDDAVRTYYVCDSELKGEFQKLYGEDAKVIHLDIETTGLNGQMHEITELGMFSPELNLKDEYVYDALNKGQKRAHPAETVRPANTTSELGLLKNFMAQLEKYEGQNIVINMHNGFRFDKKFILNRFAYQAQLAKSLNNKEDLDFCIKALARLQSGKYRFSDSLKILQQKYGYTVISDEMRLNLYYALRDFVMQQKNMAKLIQPIDPSIAKQLKDMGNKLKDALGADGSVRYDNYFNAANNIYDFFNSIKSANRELSRTLLKKSIFDDELFQKVFGLNITQALNTKGGEILDGIKRYGVKKHLDEKAIEEYFTGTFLTEAQMLFRTDIARDIDRYYGMLKHPTRFEYYKDDIKKILQKFIERALMSSNVPEDLKFLKVSDDPRTNFAILQKLFDWKSGAFENIQVSKTILKDNTEYINVADNLLDGLCFDLFQTGNGVDIRQLLEYPENVRVRAFTDDGSISAAVDLEKQSIWNEKYLTTQQRYLEKQKQYAQEAAERKASYLEDKIAYAEAKFQEYLKRVAQNEIKMDKEIIHKVDTVVRFEKKLNLPDDIAGYMGYYKAAQQVTHDYKDILDILDNLGREWDNNGAQRAVVQVRATSLKEMFNLLDAVTNRHSTLAEVNDQFKQIMKYREVSYALSLQQIDTILNLNNEDLFAHLVNNGRRWMVIDGTELNGGQLKGLLDRTKDLEAKKMHVLFKDDKIYIMLDKDVTLDVFEDATGKVKHMADGVYVPAPALPQLDVNGVLGNILTAPEDAQIRQYMAEVYDKLYRLVGDYDSDYSPHYGSIGELTNKAYYKEAYEILPDEVKKMLPHPDVMYADKFFHGATFNHSILGGSEFRRQFHQYTNSDIISMLTSTMTIQAEHLKSHVEYMNMFFDKTFSISNGEIAKFSDKDLLDALKNSDEYRLVALVNDKKYGAKVVDLNPQNISDIKKARELDAVIMAYQTYSTAFGAINSYSMRHSKLNMLHKINYLYKAGYLLSPGTIMRNVIDSVMKNYVAASDDMTGMTRSFLSAWQLYWKYRKTAKELIDSSFDAATGKARITAESTKAYFDSGVSKLSKEQYDFIHGFDMDGPSGGQIKEFEKYFQHDNTYGAYGSIIQVLNFMMEPNKVVEQVCRLAEYMWAIEKGLPTTKAYALIAKTHFDYTIKTEKDRLIELLFPFYTFTMNNIHYWLDAFDRVPALASVLRDVYTPIWNFDEYTPQELQYNRSLQYQILSGNLPLERLFGDSAHNMTLKLNPSFMDVYQLATDPINAIMGKLSPLMQTGVGMAGAGLPEEMKFAYNINTPSFMTAKTPGEVMQGILELLPIAGPILNRYFVQSPKYRERTGNWLNSILPDVFGATAESKMYNYTKTSYTPMQYNKKPKRGFVRKARRFYPKYPRRSYGKRSYGKRAYAWRSYGKRVYPKKTYAKKTYAKNFYPAMQKYYPKKVYSSIGYYLDNFYNKLYNKSTGKSRLKDMMVPVTGQTLKYRIKDMFYYYK